MTWRIPANGKRSMTVRARVFPDDLKTSSASFMFDIGLRAVRQDPGLVAAAHVEKKKTKVTSIRITCEQFYYMKSLGLNARQTIQIGISLFDS